MRRNHTVAGTHLASSPGEFACLVAVVASAISMMLVWLTGQLAGLLFKHAWPPVGFGAAAGAVMRIPVHLADPRQAFPPAARPDLPGLAGFAIAFAVVLVVMSVGLALLIPRIVGIDPGRGFATRRQLRASLAERTVIGRGTTIRPSLTGRTITVEDIGVRLGRSVPGRLPLAVSAEDSALVLAAPRQGKTSQVIIPWLHSWPGPAIVTSIRPDVLMNTAIGRQARGPVLVMAPTGMISWPETMMWSLASGCASFDKARTRADVMVTVGKSDATSDSTDGGYFALSATNLLAGWLHAADLSGGSADDVLRWAFDERLDEPIRILASTSDAADGTAAMLDALYRLPADTTRAALWTTAQTALAPLLAPAARATFTPAAGQATDLAAFLRAGGTCYLLADERRSAALAPVICAFADELLEVAKSLADTAPGARLDPPLGMFLDEVANIVPLPQLPALMSFAGGTGIFVAAVLQSMAQARNRWGHDSAAMIWDAATVKIILGGLSGDELRDISDLAGEYRETLTSWQHGQGSHTVSSTVQDRKTLTPEQIRTVSAHHRHALVIHATTPIVRVRMTRHYEGPHRREFEASRERAQQIAKTGRPAQEGNAQWQT